MELSRDYHYRVCDLILLRLSTNAVDYHTSNQHCENMIGLIGVVIGVF